MEFSRGLAHLRRALIDALAGLTAFAAIAFAAGGRWPATPDRTMTFVLLAVLFSGLVAFNLAFFRHLRRAYSPPRRGTGPKP